MHDLIETELGPSLQAQEITCAWLPSDSGEAFLESEGSLMNDWRADWEAAQVAEEDGVLLPVEAVFTECLASLSIFKGDAYSFDDPRVMLSRGNFEDDHYVEAEAYIDVRISATLEIQLQREAGSLEIDSIEVLEVESIEAGRVPARGVAEV